MCYAFSLPPTTFIKQVSRATAETAQQAALDEGMALLMGWVKRLADHVIRYRPASPTSNSYGPRDGRAIRRKRPPHTRARIVEAQGRTLMFGGLHPPYGRTGPNTPSG